MKELIGIGLMLVGALLGSLGALYLKIGSGKVSLSMRRIYNKYIIFGVIMYALSTFVAVPAYRYAELSLLYPFIATSYIWTSILSAKFLNDRMNTWKWAGIALIVVGVSFIGFGN